MVEQWREIEGTNGDYELSNFGRVRSWKNVKRGFKKEPKILKAHIRNGNPGKPGLELVVDLGKCHSVLIRHLMRDTFMEGKKPGYVVTHKDGDIHNVALSNLKYTTRKELCQKYRNQRKPVLKISKDGEIAEIYSSCNEAAKKNFVVPSTMSYRISRGITSDGFLYQYDL